MLSDPTFASEVTLSCIITEKVLPSLVCFVVVVCFDPPLVSLFYNLHTHKNNALLSVCIYFHGESNTISSVHLYLLRERKTVSSVCSDLHRERETISSVCFDLCRERKAISSVCFYLQRERKTFH